MVNTLVVIVIQAHTFAFRTDGLSIRRLGIGICAEGTQHKDSGYRAQHVQNLPTRGTEMRSDGGQADDGQLCIVDLQDVVLEQRDGDIVFEVILSSGTKYRDVRIACFLYRRLVVVPNADDGRGCVGCAGAVCADPHGALEGEC